MVVEQEMKDIQKINNIISSVTGKNKTGEIYLNAIHNEFVKIKGEFIVPSIPVKEIDTASVLSILNNLSEYIPEYMANHVFSLNKLPPSEQYHIHLVQPLSGKIIPFVHILKFDMKFGGNPEGIVKPGTTDSYHSYRADRIYFKSRLVPGEIIYSEKGHPSAVSAIKIKHADTLESDQHFHTFAVFDEIQDSELSLEYIDTVGREIFTLNPSIYTFLSHDYMTCCMNILDPTQTKINEAVSIYEPLFLYILSSFRNISDIENIDRIESLFKNELLTAETIQLTEQFKARLKNYFSKYSLDRDDELVMKGWWRIASA